MTSARRSVHELVDELRAIVPADVHPLDLDLLAMVDRAELGGFRVPVEHAYLVIPRGAPDVVKIGWTAAPTRRRLADLQTGSPVELRALVGIKGPRVVERTLHRAFATSRLHGEWFSLDDDVAAFIVACVRRAAA